MVSADREGGEMAGRDEGAQRASNFRAFDGPEILRRGVKKALGLNWKSDPQDELVQVIGAVVPIVGDCLKNHQPPLDEEVMKEILDSIGDQLKSFHRVGVPFLDEDGRRCFLHYLEDTFLPSIDRGGIPKRPSS
jgi:hypothetical protein